MNKMLVESSTLLSLAYDETCELLQLEFRSGSIYQYFSVPSAVYEALRGAPSKGSYFNRAIRGSFAYVLIASGHTREAGRA
jgi:lysyl-tRNA synthetase, class II